MANVKQAIVVVPGAWHPSTLYKTLENALRGYGYTAITANHPSLNSRNPQADSCSADADEVRRYILRLVECDGRDVVVLCHSYGGISGGGAAHGLSKTSRVKQGQNGGVIGLVYLSAFVVPENATLLQIMGGKHAPYLVPDQVCQTWSLLRPTRALLGWDLPNTDGSNSPQSDFLGSRALRRRSSTISTTKKLRN